MSLERQLSVEDVGLSNFEVKCTIAIRKFLSSSINVLDPPTPT
jgi:hypothetical protein